MINHETHFLNKAVKTFRFSSIVLLVSFSATVVASFKVIKVPDILIGGPGLLFLVSAPLGFMYSLKSLLKKEPTSRRKVLIFYGNGVYLLMSFLMIYVVFNDLIRF